jgi:predicted Zn-dependent protease
MSDFKSNFSADSSQIPTQAECYDFNRSQSSPRNANAAYEIAEIHRQGGDLPSAEKYFKMALSDYLDFQEAQVGLGATLISLDKASEALPYLQKAVVLNPGDEVAWYRLSQAQRNGSFL